MPQSTDTLAKLQALIAEEFAIPPELVTPEADLAMTLELDSLDKQELELQIENHFDIPSIILDGDESVLAVANLIDSLLSTRAIN